jgi:hypothetical protein
MDGINATAIKAGRRSMLAMHYEMTRTVDEPTPAMIRGTQLHLCVLEPTKFSESVMIYGGTRRGKAWDEFKAENEGRTIVKPAEMAELMAVSNAVHGNPHAHQLVESTEHEKAFAWDDAGYKRGKCLVDGVSATHLLEFKTTNSPTKDAWLKNSYNMGVHLQLGWYAHGCHEDMGVKLQVNVVVAQQMPPHDVWVYRVPDQILKDAYKECQRIAVMYRCCEQSNWFAGEQEQPEDYALPAWAGNDEQVELVIGGKKEVM